METCESMSHVRWESKSHIVFTPKFRRKVIDGKRRGVIGRILRDPCEQKGVEISEGHAMPDPIPLCVKIPPKSAVSSVIGFIKSKGAVRIHRELLKERRMTGPHFGAPVYWVSAVVRDDSARVPGRPSPAHA